MGKPKKHQSSDAAADELNLEALKDEGELVSIVTLKQMLEEVSEICSSFRSGTALGYDSISMNVVKESFNLICAPLTYIINLSLNSGVVPQEMKIARVIPLFKSGDKSLFTNYRPVSVLPVFSKFLERIVYNRLINFLNKYDILFRNQYGFRKIILLHML